MSTSSSTPGSVLLAPSPAGTTYDLMYFLKGAAAGGICCSITHGALCPVDVVKTRVQLDPVKYNSGLIGGMRKIVAEEGAMALTTGLGATVGGYFVQGKIRCTSYKFPSTLYLELGQQILVLKLFARFWLCGLKC